jgi:HPt (histidine-containing phosphotransfer) domain-containing protein
MDDYLTKPIDPQQLYALLERVASASPPPEPSRRPATGRDYDAVLARVGGDRQFLSEISLLFTEDMPRHLAAIQRSLDMRDGQALQRAAHLLKGAAANFEASALVDVARTLEEMGRTAHFSDADRTWSLLMTEAGLLAGVLESYAFIPLPPLDAN